MEEKEYAIDEISQILGRSEEEILSSVRTGLLDVRKANEGFFVSQAALKRFLSLASI